MFGHSPKCLQGHLSTCFSQWNANVKIKQTQTLLTKYNLSADPVVAAVLDSCWVASGLPSMWEGTVAAPGFSTLVQGELEAPTEGLRKVGSRRGTFLFKIRMAMFLFRDFKHIVYMVKLTTERYTLE